MFLLRRGKRERTSIYGLLHNDPHLPHTHTLIQLTDLLGERSQRRGARGKTHMELPETWATKYILSIQFYGPYWHGNICLNRSLSPSFSRSLSRSLSISIQFKGLYLHGTVCLRCQSLTSLSLSLSSLSLLSLSLTLSPLSPLTLSL
jgi:hypothetical protein